MNRYERIMSLLSQEFKPTRLELRDDSQSHAGHNGARPGGETHYTLVIESAAFQGLNKIQCHQAIYRLLANEFKTGLHALSIQAFAAGKK